jgi:hypothetical protein
MYEITYHPLVVRDGIPKLAAAWRTKIRRAIKDRLITHPDLYGKPCAVHSLVSASYASGITESFSELSKRRFES